MADGTWRKPAVVSLTKTAQLLRMDPRMVLAHARTHGRLSDELPLIQVGSQARVATAALERVLGRELTETDFAGRNNA